MKIVKGKKLGDIIFIDVETVRNKEVLEVGTPEYRSWKYKRERYCKEKDLDLLEDYKESASFFPEFSRVVCVTVGSIKDETKAILRTYSDKDEAKLLRMFTGDLNVVTNRKNKSLFSGHSIKAFDIPFLFKRCIVNGVIPNKLIDVADLNTWNVEALDTKLLWKGCGQYGASLDSICLALNVPSSKMEIDGGKVAELYFKGEIDKIVDYCEKDVFAVMNVIRRFRFEELFESYTVEAVKERKPDNLMERITNAGGVSEEDGKSILEISKDLDYKSKEILIRNIKGALSYNGGEIPEQLELEILKS